MSTSMLTNMASHQAANLVGKANESFAGTAERIASGERINRAADDAAAYATAAIVESHDHSMRQAIRNIEDGIQIINIVEGFTDAGVDLMSRMRELAVQSASEVLTDDERTYVAEEYDELVEEFGKTADKAFYDDRLLTDGSIPFLDVQAGFTSTAESQIRIDLPDFTAIRTALAAEDLTTASNARTAIDGIDSAIGLMNDHRGDIAGDYNRLNSAIQYAVDFRGTMTAAAATITDANMAMETAHLTVAQVKQEASIAAQIQAASLQSPIVSLISGE